MTRSTGMRYGIDLHTTTFMVAYRDANGKIKRKKYSLTPEGMESFKSILTPEDSLAIESTMTSYYFYDQVKPLVREVIIVNPFRFKVISESRSKTDKRDCATLLEYLEHGLLPAIPIPTKEIRELRRLFSTYMLTVKSRTSLKNRIYSLLKSEGVVLPKGDLYSERGVEKLEGLNLACFVRIQIDVLLAQVKSLNAALVCLKEQVSSHAVHFRASVDLLTSIPGISPFIALGLIADIGDIGNFKSAKQLTSYLGVVPRVHESNGKRWTGHITKQGRKLSRALLSQVIHHFIGSSKMYEDQYEALKKKKGAAKAIVAMMRRLLVIIFKMLKKNETFRSINEENHARKLEVVEKIIHSLECINTSDIQMMRENARLTYDPAYREKIKEEQCRLLQKPSKKLA
jgi:transposase